jgi:two-component system NtrC family sensor kinase
VCFKEWSRCLKDLKNPGQQLLIQAEKSVMVLADAEALERMVLNLATNGLQALQGQKGEVCLKLFQQGTWAIFQVIDTGIGMDQQTQGRLFTPYFTTRRSQGGSGLGLASVHGIVMALSGEIEVQSTLGKGSVFTVRLPLN